MTKYSGKDLALSISAGGSPETWSAAAGMRSNSMTINGEVVDVSDKDDSTNKVSLDGVGIVSMTVSGSGHVTNSATLATFNTRVTDRTSMRFKIASGRGDNYVGLFRVTSFERSGEYNGAEQYTIALEANGAITYTPAP